MNKDTAEKFGAWAAAAVFSWFCVLAVVTITVLVTRWLF